MEILIGTNIATFILAWIVSRLVARHRLLQEQAELEVKRINAAMWMDFIKSQEDTDG